jgi:hypothetical protein
MASVSSWSSRTPFFWAVVALPFADSFAHLIHFVKLPPLLRPNRAQQTQSEITELFRMISPWAIKPDPRAPLCSPQPSQEARISRHHRPPPSQGREKNGRRRRPSSTGSSAIMPSVGSHPSHSPSSPLRVASIVLVFGGGAEPWCLIPGYGAAAGGRVRRHGLAVRAG